MKPLVSKATEKYLSTLSSKPSGKGDQYIHRLDDIEYMIQRRGLKIEAVHFHSSLDMLLVVLNNRQVLECRISEFSRLKRASQKQLNDYKLIGKGSGIHWPQLDEDLSLKGFFGKRDFR
jgi:hypothetical protein